VWVYLRLPVMYNQLDFFCKLQIILTLEGTQHFVVFQCNFFFKICYHNIFSFVKSTL